ncbi:ATP-binding cassette domain-containing protein [Azotobacter chroococcum]|uniref:phosphate ABC transporter ATP-binding protein n=1 Tax=Azotobacter chroococcum TaxID=353 RepID=UPI001D055887
MSNPPSLSIQGLSVHYGEQGALLGASLDVAPGELMALVGPSGCGKSSLLSAVNRMSDLVPGARVSGQVLIDGQDVLGSGVDVQLLRRRVGMVFQQPNPFPLSIAENILFALREHGVRDKAELHGRMEQALQATGLWSEVRDRLHRPALGLSGGQQQRLCFARAPGAGAQRAAAGRALQRPRSHRQRHRRGADRQPEGPLYPVDGHPQPGPGAAPGRPCGGVLGT